MREICTRTILAIVMTMASINAWHLGDMIHRMHVIGDPADMLSSAMDKPLIERMERQCGQYAKVYASCERVNRAIGLSTSNLRGRVLHEAWIQFGISLTTALLMLLGLLLSYRAPARPC